jgi:hypothetical protein
MSILQGTIPDDWNGEYCRYAVCWPKSPQWEAILRGVLVLPSRGRFWDEHTGSIIEAQNVIREAYDNNLHLQEVILACNDTSLNQIAVALRLLAASQCCGDAPPANGGIQGTVTPTSGITIPIYGSAPPAELPTGEVPADFDGTLEEYLDARCQKAHAIVSGWVATLDNLSFINFASSTGLMSVIIASVAGWILLPEFLIPILIASAIVLVLVRELLRDLAAAIEGWRSQLVCWMVTFESAEAILSRIADTLDLIIAGLTTSNIYALALKTIALILMNSDTLNQLFELTQGAGDPTLDCSGCDDCTFSILAGTADEGVVMGGGTISSTIHPVSGLQGVFIDYTCDMYASFSNFVGVRLDDSGGFFSLWLNGVRVYFDSSDNPPTGPICIDQIQFGWNDIEDVFSFDIDFTETECPE